MKAAATSSFRHAGGILAGAAFSSDRGVYPMDTAVLRAWARLMHGRSDTLADDARIAATAMVHNLIVVTRNVRDFQPFAVPTLNPFHTSRRER